MNENLSVRIRLDDKEIGFAIMLTIQHGKSPKAVIDRVMGFLSDMESRLVVKEISVRGPTDHNDRWRVGIDARTTPNHSNPHF